LFIQDVIIHSNNLISDNTYIIEVETKDLAGLTKPGQFFNIRINESSFPLLRRPFSICDIIDDSIYFMYKIVGEGTAILADKKPGNKINILGPLGNNFNIPDSIDHLIILGGGIGIAPFPYLIKNINSNLNLSVLFGIRNKREAHNYGLRNVTYSSDDGSVGFHGNVVQLLDQHISTMNEKNIKIVACGPNPMLRTLRKYTIKKEIHCDVSMESAMACGFGICQGCPIEYKDQESYKLICKDGPIFDIKNIII